MVGDVRVIIKLKNNALISFREKMGWSQADMAGRLGVSPSYYGMIENLRKFPRKKITGDWIKTAQDIASLVGIPEEKLFPEHFKGIKQNRIERTVDSRRAYEFFEIQERKLLPENSVNKTELEDHIRKSFMGLTDRQEFVIRKRFGLFGEDEHTLEQVAKILKVTKERVRQVEIKAFQRLRHPKRRSYLQDFIDPEWRTDEKTLGTI